MIVGVHLPNRAFITDDEKQRRVLGKFTGGMAMWYQDPAEVAALVAAERTVVRLPNSIYFRLNSESYIPSSGDYAADCLDQIRRWHAHGFHLFVPDCEPNQTWPAHGQGEWQWQQFMFERISAMKAQRPCGVEIGLTAFSTQNFDRWRTRATRLGHLCDFISAHCYWQAPGDMTNPALGGNHQKLWDQFQKPVYITEAGNSMCQARNPPGPAALEALFRAQYPRYIQSLRQIPHIAGVYFFLLGGSDEWKGFTLTTPVCRRIRRVS